ncbi:MAG: hypothetical protein WBH31_18600 [Promethearchaeia archaeon]
MSEVTPPIRYEPPKKSRGLIQYRTWPIFVLSFLRLFFISIFERAFLNYIYFYRDLSESMLGYINSAPSIAYILV